jgi:cytochrome c biogenesis protein CcmG/thiol:disulfide interchange protein DsbE
MREPSINPRRHVPPGVQTVIWLILTGLLVVVGLGLKRAQLGTVQPGDNVPDFNLALFSGYEYNGQSAVRLSDLRGKVVVINFWASWCKPCEQEAAALEAAWQHYQPTRQVVFVGVDYVDTEPAARMFMERFGNTYPNGPDIGTRISQMFRIKGVPETYVVDTQGVLKYVKVGPFASAEEIASAVDPLLP